MLGRLTGGQIDPGLFVGRRNRRGKAEDENDKRLAIHGELGLDADGGRLAIESGDGNVGIMYRAGRKDRESAIEGINRANATARRPRVDRKHKALGRRKISH